MLGFLIRAALVALGLWLATVWVSGVSIDTPSTLILAGILLGVVNSIVRPIAILLTLPMTILTLGLFLLVINAGMVALVAWMLPGMHIAGIRRRFLDLDPGESGEHRRFLVRRRQGPGRSDPQARLIQESLCGGRGRFKTYWVFGSARCLRIREAAAGHRQNAHADDDDRHADELQAGETLMQQPPAEERGDGGIHIAIGADEGRRGVAGSASHRRCRRGRN